VCCSPLPYFRASFVIIIVRARGSKLWRFLANGRKSKKGKIVVFKLIIGRHNVEVGKCYLAEPRDKNRVSPVCFLFDCLCSQELVSSYLAILTYITSFVAISVDFYRITYSPPL
jgi:hypothetical protein